MPDDPIEGVVRSFDDEEGWGVIDAPQVPGGCFVQHSFIQATGYRTLPAGEKVLFTFERAPSAHKMGATTGQLQCGARSR